MSEPKMSYRSLEKNYDYLAPDGSEIRLLEEFETGNTCGLCHCTLHPEQISKPKKHKTVREIWYFLEGKGQVWRKQNEKEQILDVKPGDSLTIPKATHFQFRNTGSNPLKFIIVTIPKWPGPDEAVSVEGKW